MKRKLINNNKLGPIDRPQFIEICHCLLYLCSVVFPSKNQRQQVSDLLLPLSISKLQRTFIDFSPLLAFDFRFPSFTSPEPFVCQILSYWLLTTASLYFRLPFASSLEIFANFQFPFCLNCYKPFSLILRYSELLTGTLFRNDVLFPFSGSVGVPSQEFLGACLYINSSQTYRQPPLRLI